MKAILRLSNTSTLISLGISLTAGLTIYACGKPNEPAPPTHDDLVEEAGNDDPQELKSEANFADLINKYAQGQPMRQPWAGSYWPYIENGVASPQYSESGNKFGPAGKYDAARGCKTKAQEWEIGHHGKHVKDVAGWWGHCNGWSAAASLYPEPPSEMTVNGVRFTRADMKALLTEAGMVTEMDSWGERVEPASVTNYHSPEYLDISPDQYFLVLTNTMGKQKLPLIVDEFTGNEIWNQPVLGYRFEYPKRKDVSADPAHPDIYKIAITGTIWWASDSRIDPNDKTPPFNFETIRPFFDERVLKMELWVDGPIVFDANEKIVQSGNVIVASQGRFVVGGDWRDSNLHPDHAHPDFLWSPKQMLDASDPEVNQPEEPLANPHIDYRWLVNHFVNHTADEPDSVGRCPVPPVPSPSPVPSPRPSTTPERRP